MSTEIAPTTTESPRRPGSRPAGETVCWFEGQWTPLADATLALESVKDHPDVDPERIGMWGHSMGGYITMRAMVVRDDIKAGVVWAGVVGSYADLLENWRRNPNTIPPAVAQRRRGWRTELVERFGTPQEDPEFWASISADATEYDFGRYPQVPKPVVPGGALDRLMEKYPNLYGDLSEPGGERAIARDVKFGREFIIRRADQLLFGTDVLMPEQKIPQFELLESLKLPDEVRYKVYRGNAIKLLKLPKDKT